MNPRCGSAAEQTVGYYCSAVPSSLPGVKHFLMKPEAGRLSLGLDSVSGVHDSSSPAARSLIAVHTESIRSEEEERRLIPGPHCRASRQSLTRRKEGKKTCPIGVWCTKSYSRSD